MLPCFLVSFLPSFLLPLLFAPIPCRRAQAKPIDQVSDAPAWVRAEGMLSALRFGPKQLNRTLVTLQQQADRSTWLHDGPGSSGTGVDGVYLPRSAVLASNTRVDYCPVPTRLCLAPAELVMPSSDGDAPSTANLTLSGLGVWGCDSDLFAFTLRVACVGCLEDDVYVCSNISK